MKVINPIQVSRPIDAFGMKGHRRYVAAIQKTNGAQERKAAAQAKRDRRAQRRSHRAS